MFCDAQCGLIESVNNEIDPVSDEEEFWDAQSSFKGYDDSTFDQNTDKESNIKVLSVKAAEDEKEDENPSPDSEQCYSVSGYPEPGDRKEMHLKDSSDIYKDQYHCKDAKPITNNEPDC